MFTSILLSAVLLSPSAPVPKARTPVGPPPMLVYVHPAVADGRVTVTVQAVRTITERFNTTVVENGVRVVKENERTVDRPVTTTVALDAVGATFTTAADKPLTADEVATRFSAGGVLIVPAEGDAVDPAYLKAFTADAVVVSYTLKGNDRKTFLPARVRANRPVPAVPALVAVKADAKGVLAVPAKGTREETMQITVPKVENGETVATVQDVKRTVTALVPTPFDDVKPTVTTADGKPVAVDEAKKQLAAGALVLVSGDGKPLDEVYRKVVPPTTLVLLSDKMAMPPRTTLPALRGGLTPVQAVPVPAK